MRFLLIVVALVGGFWSYACYVTPADTGPHHSHEEDRDNKVWVDPHRNLIGCKHCRAARVYYDGKPVTDWGNWTPAEIRAAGPNPATSRP